MRTRPIAALIALLLLFTLARADKPARRYLERNRALPNVPSPPFSRAVLVGDTLYISGDIGLDPKTNKPPATAEEEARNVMESLKKTLADAGMTMDDLVWVQVNCPDVANYGAFNSVYRTYFKSEFPARAFLGSGKLLFDGRFEVMGIAVKR